MAAEHVQLRDRLLPFVGDVHDPGGGGGRWAFRLLCSAPDCGREAFVSANARTILSARRRLAACDRLVQRGWGFGDGPLCPSCRHQAAERRAG